MDSQKILNKIEGKFSDVIIESNLEVAQPYVRIKTESFKAVCEYLLNDPDLFFDFLVCLSGVDWKDNFEVVYHLYSMTYHHKIVLKVTLDRENPIIASIASIWKTANWHEREAYDFFGIIFDGHPDLRRILLPEDWEGHPLRKDYIPQKKYKGIDLT